jgi:hypothetical protein
MVNSEAVDKPLVDEIFITKTNDGPSIVIKTTEEIILFLIKNRKMGTQKVRDFIINAVTDENKAKKLNVELGFELVSDDKAEKLDVDLGFELANDDKVNELRAAVNERINYLLNVVKAHGKVSLLPSTTNLRTNMIPALEFLLRATSPVAASDTSSSAPPCEASDTSSRVPLGEASSTSSGVSHVVPTD